MQKIRVLACLNFLFFLLHLIPSQLSQFRVFSALNMGEVSNKYDTLFTPAGSTFAIWGLIYLSLFIFFFYHLYQSFRAPLQHEANTDLNKIGYLFMLNNAATGLWTIVFVNEQLLLSVVLIIIQLISLLLIHVRLGIYQPFCPAASRWCTQFPLSIYFAWICIATIANISAWLVSWGWSGLGLSDTTWATIMIAIATILSFFVILNRHNPYFGLVVIWAFYGIILKQTQQADTGQVSIAAWVGLVVIAVIILYQFVRNQNATTQTTIPDF